MLKPLGWIKRVDPSRIAWGKTKSNASQSKTVPCDPALLQLRVLGLGLLQDGDVGVGVGVFPEREEIIVCGLRFCGAATECVGA